jgi:hypothetical protein
MAYYHVLIADKAKPDALQCILWDLDEHSLQTKFLEPFAASQDILIEGRIYRVADIGAVTIRSTDRPSDQELKSIQDESWADVQRFNRESPGLMLVSAGQGYSKNDLAHAGTDVTSAKLRLPSASPFWERYGKEIIIGVVVTVLGGLILALLL